MQILSFCVLAVPWSHSLLRPPCTAKSPGHWFSSSLGRFHQHWSPEPARQSGVIVWMWLGFRNFASPLATLLQQPESGAWCTHSRTHTHAHTRAHTLTHAPPEEGTGPTFLPAFAELHPTWAVGKPSVVCGIGFLSWGFSVLLLRKRKERNLEAERIWF